MKFGSLYRYQFYRWRKWITPSILFVLFLYFVVHMISGSNGLLAMRENSEKLVSLEQQLKTEQTKLDDLQKHIKGLRPESLDLDLLEERAQYMLNYAGDNDILVVGTQEHATQ